MKRKSARKLPQLDPNIVLSKRMLTSHKAGRAGGLATSRRYGPEFCERRSTKGGQSCLARYGIDFYRHICNLRWERHRKQQSAAKKKAI